MLRREHLPPDLAVFKVPLRFNKFDLRDYLWNLYGVEVTDVRVRVVQPSTLYRSGPDGTGQFRRQAAQKLMTVTLARPFRWPDVPKDLSAWDKHIHDATEKESKDYETKQRRLQTGWLVDPADDGKLDPLNLTLKERAEALLAGKQEWKVDHIQADEKWRVDEDEVRGEEVTAEMNAVDGTAMGERTTAEVTRDTRQEDDAAQPKKKWKPWLRKFV